MEGKRKREWKRKRESVFKLKQRREIEMKTRNGKRKKK